LRPGLQRIAQEAKQLELSASPVLALFNSILKGK
jgi:hypothetical protein